MKRLNIGFFIDSFYPMIDGVTMVVDNYARRLCKNNNVYVFVPKVNFKGSNFSDDTLPYKVIRCKSFYLPIVGDYNIPLPDLDKDFKKTLNSIKLDIVHIHSPFTVGKIGVKYAKDNNIPIVSTLHSLFKQDFKRALKFDFLASFATNRIIKVFNESDLCLTVNNEVARIYKEDYKLKLTPRLLSNATELKDEVTTKEIKDLNKEYDLKDDEKVLLFVGRINRLKNIFFIVDSLKIFKEKNSIKFKMLFVGTGLDEENLKQYVKDNNLEENIILCGSVTDRKRLSVFYKRADLFLFPSFYDTNSLVQIEAACFKTPTLFLEGSATSTTVTDNVNGLISKNNPTSYTNRIIEVLSNKDFYDKISENAHKDLYKTFDDVVKDLENIYIELINDKN